MWLDKSCVCTVWGTPSSGCFLCASRQRSTGIQLGEGENPGICHDVCGWKPLSAVEIMNNSKLLNNASAKPLPYISFLDNLPAVIAYCRTFDECYEVPFHEERLMDIRRDMRFVIFIPGVRNMTYNRYLCVAVLCLFCPMLFN